MSEESGIDPAYQCLKTFGAKLEWLIERLFARPQGATRRPRTYEQLAAALNQKSTETNRKWRRDETVPDANKLNLMLAIIFGPDLAKDTPADEFYRQDVRSAWEAAWARKPRKVSDTQGEVLGGGAAPAESLGAMYGVPPRNPDFTGRDDDLAKLHAILTGNGDCRAAAPVAVFGMGGIGKTSLATAYAHNCIAEYAGIWWAPAENRTALLASLAQLGSLLHPDVGKNPDLELVAKRTLVLLGASSRPWLLIYDNVPTPADIRGLIANGKTHVLITTRWANWAGVAKEMELDLWPPDAAISFLIKGVKSISVGDAGRLVQTLGYLPLAISHAAAYLRHTRMSVIHYLWRLQELMAEPPISADYPRSIYATFTLAVAQAVSECPVAHQLLAVLAVLAPERVPLWLIEKVMTDEILRNRAIATLSLVSLIRHDAFDENSPAVIVHRLVQAVMRERLRSQENDLAEVGNRAVAAVIRFFPEEPFRATGNWLQCEMLTPHAEHLLKLAEKVSLEPDAFLTLGYRLGRFLHGRSELRKGARVYFHTVLAGRNSVGCEHPLVTKVTAVFANLFRDRGQFRYAEPLARASVKLATAKHGRDNADVAEYLNGLGALLRDIKRFPEARTCFEEAISIGEIIFGKDSLRVATFTNNYGVQLYLEAEFGKAAEMFGRAIAIGEAERGTNDVDVATWRHNLAQVLVASGSYFGARKLMMVVMPVLQKELGRTHPNFLRSRVTFAKILLAENEPEAARVEADAAVALYELKRDHPWTVDAARTLVRALVALNRLNEADDVSMKYGVTPLDMRS